MNSTSHWTVQTIAPDYELGPYIQAKYGGVEVHAEITSNTYLKPKFDEFLTAYMWELGWLHPIGRKFPNFNYFVDNDLDGHEKLPKLWVRTLVEVYGMQQNWKFCYLADEAPGLQGWQWNMEEDDHNPDVWVFSNKAVTGQSKGFNKKEVE